MPYLIRNPGANKRRAVRLDQPPRAVCKVVTVSTLSYLALSTPGWLRHNSHQIIPLGSIHKLLASLPKQISGESGERLLPLLWQTALSSQWQSGRGSWSQETKLGTFVSKNGLCLKMSLFDTMPISLVRAGQAYWHWLWATSDCYKNKHDVCLSALCALCLSVFFSATVTVRASTRQE